MAEISPSLNLFYPETFYPETFYPETFYPETFYPETGIFICYDLMIDEVA
jgi:hypothetical protein